MGKYSNYKICVECNGVFNYKQELEKIGESELIIKNMPSIYEGYKAINSYSPYAGLCMECFLKNINKSIAASAIALSMDCCNARDMLNKSCINELMNIPETMVNGNLPPIMRAAALEQLEYAKFQALSHTLKGIKNGEDKEVI